LKHHAKKKWGQNFLVDPNLLNKIIRTIKPKKIDNILEIGPGEGALTEMLLPSVNNISAIEIDPILVEHLLSNKILKESQVLQGDVLSKDLAKLSIEKPIKIVGNIPYNITSPILFWLIEQREHWFEAYLMVQKEVADRLVARIGTKSYGRLTVMAGVFLDIVKCFNIPPEVFRPQPKVDSAFIKIVSKKTPIVDEEKFNQFENIVKAAFSKRRKMLQNSLKSFDIAQTVREKIDFTRRPETLSVAEFAELV